MPVVSAACTLPMDTSAFDKERYRDFLYEKAVGVFQNIGNIEAIEAFKNVLKIDQKRKKNDFALLRLLLSILK